MKKIIALAAAVAVSVVSAFALDVAVGARGAFGMGLGTSTYDDIDLDMGKSLNFGGAVFGKIGITEQISVQPEIGFTHHTVGLKVDAGGETYKGTVGVNTLDIPVLVGYNLEVMDGFTVTPFLGPQLSFVLGKGKLSGDIGDGDCEFKSPLLFDVVLGANCAYEVGHGAIVADLRYNLGLIALKEKESEEKLVTPRALGLSVGYQLKLGE
ncbi:MAG: PorT family protein [Spirochaetaceae bacterium]|nr:PorT family protein [Spirochaetaceae bacterium]